MYRTGFAFQGAQEEVGTAVVVYTTAQSCRSPNSWRYSARNLPRFPSSQHSACSEPGKDYWDMGSMTAQAPSTWLEDLGKADVSWVFAATGLV